MKNFATKAERNKAISLLKEARERIEQRRANWVCSAISDSACSQTQLARGYAFGQRIAQRLRREIRVRIEDCGLVDTWLQSKRGIPSHLLTDTNVRQYRLLWIDSMIAELESQGV